MNAQINAEEPLDLIVILNQRMQATTSDARKVCDEQLYARFMRAHCTVLVAVAHLDEEEELPALSLVLSLKVRSRDVRGHVTSEVT